MQRLEQNFSKGANGGGRKPVRGRKEGGEGAILKFVAMHLY